MDFPFQSSELTLVQRLREEICDNEYAVPAFSLSAGAGKVRSGAVNIRNGFLTTEVIGGALDNLSVSLTGMDTDTVGGLVDALTRARYCVTPEEDADRSHSALDLIIKGHGRDLSKFVSFFHRRWSDDELRTVLTHAAQRHNVNYTISNVPDEELGFIVTLAAASICRSQAQRGVKRRGLSFDAGECIKLAESYEKQYDGDRRRQQRAIPVAQINDSKIGKGDIVVGISTKRSLRYGYNAPATANTPPDAPELHVLEEDIADTTVRLRWDRIRAAAFYGFEIWRDTTADVRRGFTGNVAVAPASTYDTPNPTTAKLVFSALGTDLRYGRPQVSYFGENFGQNITTYVDGLLGDCGFWNSSVVGAQPLEPETTYYYRIFVFDQNGEVVGSNTVEVQTKDMRAFLSKDVSVPFISPVMGSVTGGVACTIKGKGFHQGMKARLGDKWLTNLVVVDAETATFVTTQVYNPATVNARVDLIIRSKNGLEDMRVSAFQYTGGP